MLPGPFCARIACFILFYCIKDAIISKESWPDSRSEKEAAVPRFNGTCCMSIQYEAMMLMYCDNDIINKLSLQHMLKPWCGGPTLVNQPCKPNDSQCRFNCHVNGEACCESCVKHRMCRCSKIAEAEDTMCRRILLAQHSPYEQRKKHCSNPSQQLQSTLAQGAALLSPSLTSSFYFTSKKEL